MTAIFLFVAAILVAPAFGQEPNQPARITGRVVAAETGRPLMGAVVELRGSQSAMTNADGRFELSERRVGTYTLLASKAGYVPSVFGGAANQASQVEVLAGKRIDCGDIRLQRGSVISGRLMDDYGEPIEGANVVALRIEFSQPGTRSWQTIKQVPTNDLGEYRIHGLLPGRYYVSALRSPLPPELNLPAAAQAASISTGGSVASARQHSEPIVVDTVQGGETGGMNLTLNRTRQVRVAGSVVDSRGQPAVSASVTLRQAQSVGSPLDGGGAQARAKGGEFAFTNVPVGEYRLTVSADFVRDNPVPPGGRVTAMMVHESASMSISITEDISSLTVHTTQAKASPAITGRVFIDGAPAETATRLRMVILPSGQHSMVPRESAAGSIISTFPAGRPAPGGRLLIPSAAAGVIVLRHAGSPELSLKSVMAHGLDVTDGFDVTQSAGGINVDVHLTAQGPVLKGVVKDTDGALAAARDVVLFSVDRASWTVPLSRRVATVQTDDKGAFQASSLPAGQYLAVALADLDRAMWADPDRLERLRTFATPFSLTDATTTAIELVVKR